MAPTNNIPCTCEYPNGLSNFRPQFVYSVVVPGTKLYYCCCVYCVPRRECTAVSGISQVNFWASARRIKFREYFSRSARNDFNYPQIRLNLFVCMVVQRTTCTPGTWYNFSEVFNADRRPARVGEMRMNEVWHVTQLHRN